ncbi:5978_t:CDS:2 [Racocetra persica]|uniref:5978_t:CDS:1 n=1 Tax=Racocetra persica TaxID=160502 RepID=A0ACA9LVV2_9GLOM|nr:5978_t:CDS:2 [Racocetra persica]
MMIFMLGIQSTSFVESQNVCIKRVLKNSNTSLCDLGKVLMERGREEQKRKQFEEWKRNIPSMVNTTTIFSTIKPLVKHYLRPNIVHFLLEQMKESLYYTAHHATIEEIELLISYEPLQNEDIDDEPNAVILCAMYLLEHLEQNSIMEIWKISRVTSYGINHFIFLLADGSYSCTCLLQQKQGLVYRHFYHLLNITDKVQFSLQLIAPHWISKHQRLDTAKECTHFGQHFNNMLFYEEVWGLAHTAINKCMLYRDNEFVSLIEDYLNKVSAREEELIRAQEDMTSASTNQNDNTEISTIQLVNPRKVAVKGRPKAVHHHNKNITKVTSQEASKKKRGQYTCGYCKEAGHNIATCPNKT